MIFLDYSNTIFENERLHINMSMDHEGIQKILNECRDHYNLIQEMRSQNKQIASDIIKYIKESFNDIDYNKKLFLYFDEYEFFIKEIMSLSGIFFKNSKNDPEIYNFLVNLIPQDKNLSNRISLKQNDFKRCQFVNELNIFNELYNQVSKFIISYEVFFKGLIIKLNEIGFLQMESYCLSIDKYLNISINIKNLKAKSYYDESIYKNYVDFLVTDKISKEIKDLKKFYERLNNLHLLDDNKMELHPSILNKSIRDAYSLLYSFNRIFVKKFSTYVLNVNKILFLQEASYKRTYLMMKEIPYVFNKLLRNKINNVIIKSEIPDILNFDEIVKSLENKTFLELEEMSKEIIRENIFKLNNLKFDELNKINNFSYGLVYKTFNDLSENEKELYKIITNEIKLKENNEKQFRILKNDPKMTKSKYRIDAIVFDNDDVQNLRLIKQLNNFKNISQNDSFVEETKMERIKSSCNKYFIDVIYKKVSIFFNNPKDIMVIK